MQTPKWLLDASGCPGFLGHELRAREERLPYIHHTETLRLKIPSRYGLVFLNDKVEDVVRRSGVLDGQCFVSSLHITAGFYVNDAEDGLLHDLSGWLEKLAPYGLPYRHHFTGEDNADAHLKSFLTNHFVVAPVTKGRLDFGTWQRIFYAEFDGLREKSVIVKVMGIL